MSASVFPARAGMSPTGQAPTSVLSSVPRASGDEPDSLQTVKNGKKCSPRERG